MKAVDHAVHNGDAFAIDAVDAKSPKDRALDADRRVFIDEGLHVACDRRRKLAAAVDLRLIKRNGRHGGAFARIATQVNPQAAFPRELTRPVEVSLSRDRADRSRLRPL